MNPAASVPLCASVFVTTTFAFPAVPAGVMHVSEVDETNEIPVAAVPPIVTIAPVPKFAPLIVTDVPPENGPWIG